MFKNKKHIIVVALIMACFCSLAQEQDKAIVDYSATLSRIKNKGEYVELIGNVVFYHNGVFITCDTAYRYSEQRMEGVGNVIINSDSTYIYGDKFIYNGETNIAEVFAPLIKTVDKDVVMYTHNLKFNTLDNIATYYGGGTTSQKDNLMESEQGNYNSSTRSVLLTGDVQMENEKYKIQSDTVRYDFDSEIVTFLTKTQIWNYEGEILLANRGTYQTKDEIYDFYNKAYLLTKEQELWADSMIYRSKVTNAELHNNGQILDTLKRVISLGDMGYWDGVKNRVMLTENPAVVSYPEQGVDTSFLRADTLLIVPIIDPTQKDSTLSSASISDHIQTIAPQGDSSMILPQKTDSLIAPPAIVADSTEVNQGEIEKNIATDSEEKLNWFQRLIKRFKERRQRAKLEREKRQELKSKQRELKAHVRDSIKMARLERLANLSHHGHNHSHNSHSHDHDEVDSLQIDSTIASDSLLVSLDSAGVDSMIFTPKAQPDSSDYFVFGLRNVKNYMKDVQMVCDSMIINSFDSTTTLHISPYIWNTGSQILSDSIKFFTLNNEPYKAEMFNFPILGQELDTTHYNQIKGKFMEAFFKNSAIDVLYVDGNSECVYFRQEEDKYISALINVTSANMEIFFDSTFISDIKWFKDIDFQVYPTEDLPEDASTSIEGFSWQYSLAPKSRYDITKRQILPSQRAKVEAIEKPQFSITKTIDGEKKSLIKNGVWKDRNEPLPIDKNEFINRQY